MAQASDGESPRGPDESELPEPPFRRALSAGVCCVCGCRLLLRQVDVVLPWRCSQRRLLSRVCLRIRLSLLLVLLVLLLLVLLARHRLQP